VSHKTVFIGNAHEIPDVYGAHIILNNLSRCGSHEETLMRKQS